METATQDLIMRSHGVAYHEAGTNIIVRAEDDDLYDYQVFIGHHHMQVERGDSLYYLSDNKKIAYLNRGTFSTASTHWGVITRGYMPENKSCGLLTKMTLPYINACSARQVFPPERPGDPTLQLLTIPPYTKEQAHHVHSTVRVVYVLAGQGICVVGTPGKTVVRDLSVGMTVILQKMCPHHFETSEQNLLVLTLHIFSSLGSLEKNHPMYNGTAIL